MPIINKHSSPWECMVLENQLQQKNTINKTIKPPFILVLTIKNKEIFMIFFPISLTQLILLFNLHRD